MVEVLHFMGGEDSPRRVLCPWRAHRLASTLPAVARATAVCFLRCECLRGREIGLLRDPSRRWGAKCSPGRDNLENRASVRLCGTCWEPLKTAGQPCDEHLAPQRWLGSLGRPTPRAPSQALTPQEAHGRRSSNGRQGAGQPVRGPPGTEHPPRAILAAHEVKHLDHLVSRSSYRVKLLLQLPKRVPAPSFSTGLALSSMDSLRRQGTQGTR